MLLSARTISGRLDRHLASMLKRDVGKVLAIELAANRRVLESRTQIVIVVRFIIVQYFLLHLPRFVLARVDVRMISFLE